VDHVESISRKERQFSNTFNEDLSNKKYLINLLYL
jgi:hypothetical protein